MSEYRFPDYDAEVALAADLKHYGRRIFDGRSDPTERCKRVRAAIIAANLAHRITASSAESRPERFSEAFKRIYKQPLQPEQPKGKKHVTPA